MWFPNKLFLMHTFSYTVKSTSLKTYSDLIKRFAFEMLGGKKLEVSIKHYL